VSEEPALHDPYHDALQQLFDLTDAYFAEKGRYPSLVRVGVTFGRAILKAGASRAQYPDFQIEIDETLEPNEVVMDDEPRPRGEKERAAGRTARVRILPEIVDVIQKTFKNAPYGECYVGITSDFEGRLVGEHKVSKLRDLWIAVPATSHAVAREAQRFFLDAGMEGDPEKGDETATIVFVYRKSRFTEP
jgi:hypothetical protein